MVLTLGTFSRSLRYTHERRSRNDVPVMTYWESALNAMSQTQRWDGSVNSVSNVKSAVFQRRTVVSPDDVASNLHNVFISLRLKKRKNT